MGTNDKLQSLANQIDWCRTTKQYLIDLNNKLHSVATNHQTSLDNLRKAGYIADGLSKLEEMNREFQELNIDLMGHIEREHLAYIEKQSIGLRGDLDRILGS